MLVLIPGRQGMALSEESQVVVPQSFVDLFIPPGRLKPPVSREEIEARYEVCEDLARALTERAGTVLQRDGVTEQDVMDVILAGLVADDAGLASEEAMWVARRLAELLQWRDVWL
ncbi:MAG TPA: ATPase with chaperone activity [Burkholderiaceae bacterium]|nr:ATPase with chaperone activity [Burkholderiaceae bacterium]